MESELPSQHTRQPSNHHQSSQHLQQQSKMQQQHQHYKHLIQSPYKVPILPQLYNPADSSEGSHRSTGVAASSINAGSLRSEPESSISSPIIPLKQWPYVQSAHPQAWDPSAVAVGPSPAASHQEIEQRHSSVSTAESSTASEEDLKNKKKSRPKHLGSKFKSTLKDLFARDEQSEPASTSRRRPHDPWYDEDY